MASARYFVNAGVLVLAVTVTTTAFAGDMPRRKSGLWETQTQTQTEGMPSHGAMQMCVDQASDNVLQERAKEQSKCSTMDVSHGLGGKTVIHAVCQVDAKTTATTDAVITGNFDTRYKSEMTVTYTPPMHGTSTMKMVTEAKWLGPCKPGQKPGDMTMPNMPGGKMNLQDMMNDPRIQEMMKRQRPQ